LKPKFQIKKRLTTMTLAVLLLLCIGGIAAPSAQAVSAQCGWPRCTVYLTKQETQRFAYDGVIPQPPGGPWMAAYYMLAMGHRWFAIQYANRGMCIAFSLSAVPWETQGMWARNC